MQSIKVKDVSGYHDKTVSAHNTYAEIQRVCNLQQQHFGYSKTETQMLLHLGGRTDLILERVYHPSAWFYIYSNGTYYVVLDFENNKRELYKLRE